LPRVACYNSFWICGKGIYKRVIDDIQNLIKRHKKKIIMFNTYHIQIAYKLKAFLNIDDN